LPGSIRDPHDPTLTHPPDPMKRLKIIGLVVVILTVVVAWVVAPKGDIPKVGDPAPDFTLVSNEGTEVTLSDYKEAGQWVVLYFYPKDFTSGCTIQARKFQEDMAKYEERDAVILGVSVDDAETHAEFCEEEGLRFKLLADIGGNVSEEYGSVRGAGDVKLSARNTFLIAPDGKVAAVYVGVNPNTNSQEVLAKLDELLDA